MSAEAIQQKKQQIAQLQSQLEARIARLQAEIDSLQKLNSYVRLRAIAGVLGVSGQTVIRMVKDGRLKGHRLSPRGRWWISKRSFNKLCADIASRRSELGKTN